MKAYLITFITLFAVHVTAAEGFKAHEWGTFTSVQGSDGETLAGLEHEEEALPSFIHNRNVNTENEVRRTGLDSTAVFPYCKHKCGKGECCDDFISGESDRVSITQKMETPVLYFYSSTPRKVDVTVDFPKGIISQYYPLPSSVLPKHGRNQTLSGGQIHYSGLEILTGDASFPAVMAGNVYAPARETAANPVRIQNETEKFIFYRGLGNFKTSLKVTSTTDKLSLQETFGNKIPYLVAINIRDGKGAFQELGALNANSTKNLQMKNFQEDLTPREDLTTFEKKVGQSLVNALIESGLFPDEARSMVNTWRLSYFHTEGLRVLYILPRVETDALLPIRITPTPDELVRTLVGRVEVLTKTEENSLVAFANLTSNGTTDAFPKEKLGRFLEPKLRRLIQVANDSATKNFLQSQLK